MNIIKKLCSRMPFCFIVSIIVLVNTAEAQTCVGFWSLQRPATIQCIVGQWVGWQVSSETVGCPINPVYVGTETNTFTFSNPVGGFSIDFLGFDGVLICARIAIGINGIFYPLTSANLVDFPSGTTCIAGSFNYITLTPEGYIIKSTPGLANGPGRGRIIINNVNATSVTVSTNDINGTVFSNPFNCTTVVPLELLSFRGIPFFSCKAELNWQTGNELNIKDIEVERSDDGITFKKIATVMPKGENSNYLYETNNATDGYFRLRINDLDRNFKFSEIIKLKANCDKSNYIVTPNPTQSQIEISGLTNNDDILIFDMIGKKILSFIAPSGSNKFDIQRLPTGVYDLQIINAGVVKDNIRIIKN